MSFSISLKHHSSGDGNKELCQCLVSGDLDFSTANEALEAVGEVIRTHELTDIDLSGVNFTNSAGLALMVDWLSVARSSSHSVTFSHIPDSLHQLAEVSQVRGLI